jgi:hypothetical protein
MDLGIALDSTSVVEEIRKAQEQSDDLVGLEFSHYNGVWYKGHKLYLLNDPKLYMLLLSEFNDTLTASHFGRDCIIAAIKRWLYWPKVRDSLLVRGFLQSLPSVKAF